MTTPSKEQFSMRRIQPKDNPSVAQLIRSVMTEFGAVGPGYSINDPEVDRMYENYSAPGHAFWVIVDADDQTQGCGGIGPLQGAATNYCELKKMYFYNTLRGLGWGRRLLEEALLTARQMSYEFCYLETLERMTAARRLYTQAGFEDRCEPLGATGHGGCDAYMVKVL